jgi:hypothetical protein
MGGEISKANNFALSNLHHFKDSANSKCSAYGLRAALTFAWGLDYCARAAKLPRAVYQLSCLPIKSC